MNKKAFTLIEILVVLGIMSLLASMIIVSTRNARIRVRDARRISDIAQVSRALELYLSAHNHYPAQNDLSVLQTERFINAIPQDPIASGCTSVYDGADYGGLNCYGYAWNPAVNPTEYHLWSELESEDRVLSSDNDLDSAGWNGAATDGGDEFDCADDTPADCVYDVSVE